MKSLNLLSESLQKKITGEIVLPETKYFINEMKTIGIDKYGLEDDIQMDAIDNTIAVLMQRAGMGNEPKKEAVGAEQLKKLEATITGKADKEGWLTK